MGKKDERNNYDRFSGKQVKRHVEYGNKKNIKNKQPKLSVFKIRLLETLFIALLFFLAYTIFDIKLTYGDDFEKRAILQLTSKGVGSEQPITPNRGAIVDRNNEKSLAMSVKTYSIFIDTSILVTLSDEVQQNSLELVSRTLDIPMETLREYVAVEKELDKDGNIISINFKNPDYNTPYLVLKRDIPREVAKEIEDANARCVYIEEGTKRSYLDISVAAQTIGFIRGDSTWGLELQYDEMLTGMPGRIYREFTDGGNMTPKRIDAIDGYTLVTTIDYQLQKVAEELVIKYGEHYNSQNASIIIMKPSTGEVLSIAAYPSFDLKKPDDISKVTKAQYATEWEGLSQSEQIEKLNSVWKNYNISSTIEPGSVFKPFVVAAALEENVITLDDRFYCPGYMEVAGYRINCHKTSGHGSLSLIGAVAQSCNVAMMDIAEKLGRKLFLKYQRDFGFGEKTGIDLPGEESAAALLFGLSELNDSELATSSFGQRFNVTPIQIIDAYTALINGGNLMKPYVVSRILDGKNNLITENLPTIQRKVLSKETSDFIRKAMQEVIKPTGTGRGAYIEGYAIGGKTGTAEQGVSDTPDYHYAVLIVGFLPVDNPEYLALAIVDYPEEFQDGVTTAAPMMKELLQAIISQKNIQPEDGANIDELLSVRNDMIEIPDLIGKTTAEATGILNSLGLDYDFIGSSGSVITNQHPQAGKTASKSATVLLTINVGNAEPKDFIPVPNVEGMTPSEAKKYIEVNKLVPVVFLDEQLSSESPITSNSEANAGESEAVDSEDSEYRIYQQMPKADTRLIEGTQIKLKAKIVKPSE